MDDAAGDQAKDAAGDASGAQWIVWRRTGYTFERIFVSGLVPGDSDAIFTVPPGGSEGDEWTFCVHRGAGAGAGAGLWGAPLNCTLQVSDDGASWVKCASQEAI